MSVSEKIAQELNVKVERVAAAVALLDDGATVPFIARYRKEATGGLDDTQLRTLAERLLYLRELDERRALIIKTITEQEKLTPALKEQLMAADSKNRLEDLYLPYKPKRRTKAQIAREAGLGPLADTLLAEPTSSPETFALEYINEAHNIADVKAALDGARQILMEQMAEDPELLASLREFVWDKGVVTSTVVEKQQSAAKKYTDYFDFSEAIKKIPSHRALALFRGRREGFLQLTLTTPEHLDYAESQISAHFAIADKGRAADSWLAETVRYTWKVKLQSKIELELMARLRESADSEAIKVFANNLRDLLLSAPAGDKVTIGLDPGIRTGVKVVVVDITGKLLDYTTVYPLQPQNQWHESIVEIAKLAMKYNVSLISIGNGTGSRETERLVSELATAYPDLSFRKLVVSEAGASVYSASELAAKEFPELDVSLRGAVSIARRLQDPLAELVKIEPKAIGVGQYQHDVNQTKLSRGLEAVVEDCVNAVGVDVNTASAALLKRVAGLSDTLANNIVSYRNEHGVFTSREALLAVERMGEKSYQQAAGFLRIQNGDNPLDRSAVHPESYPLVEKILATHKKTLKEVINQPEFLHSLHAADFTDEQFGLPTVKDVIAELEKPGRDPRPEFRTVNFKEGVEEIGHLEKGMLLEGVVSNVTNFGAFVDIGVHQDGLVHISAMTNQFIDDPRKVVKAGDIVKVKVQDVDKSRRRISLTMKLDDSPDAKPARKAASNTPKKTASKVTGKGKPSSVHAEKKARPKQKAKEKPIFNSAMADALAKFK